MCMRCCEDLLTFGDWSLVDRHDAHVHVVIDSKDRLVNVHVAFNVHVQAALTAHT